MHKDEKFKGRCGWYVRNTLFGRNITNETAIAYITAEHWQELGLRPCPPDHPKPDAWRELTAKTMLKSGDKFFRNFIQKKEIDIGDSPEEWLWKTGQTPVPNQARINERMMQKYLHKYGFVYTTHLQYFLTGKGNTTFLQTYSPDDEELVLRIMDYVALTTPDQYGFHGALIRKFPPDDLTLFDSLEDWFPFLKFHEPELTIGTLRVRHTRWKKTVVGRFMFLCDQFKADDLQPTGKGQIIEDEENDELESGGGIGRPLIFGSNPENDFDSM